MLDGTLADPDQPWIRVDDLGLMRGDGIFETVLVVDGRPREIQPHLDRLARSAAMLDLPLPDQDAWRRGARAVLDNWTGEPEMVLKMICTRGIEGGDGTPTAFVLGLSIAPAVLHKRAVGVAAVLLDRGYDTGLAERAPWLLLGAKTLSYAVNMAVEREAVRRGADEVIFVSTDGYVLEGPTSSVVTVHGRTLRTPPPQIGILRGTTQGALFRAAEGTDWSTKVEPLRVDDLWSADAVLLASSVRKITRVHTLDGKALPDSTERHRELSALYESQYRAQ